MGGGILLPKNVEEVITKVKKAVSFQSNGVSDQIQKPRKKSLIISAGKRSFLHNILDVFLLLVFWFWVFPVLLPPLIFLFVWKVFVKSYVKFRHYFSPLPWIPLSGIDNLCAKEGLNSYIGFAFDFNKPLEITSLRKRFKDTFFKGSKYSKKFPIFHQLVTRAGGCGFKYPVSIDFSQHIYEVDVPNHEALDAALSRIMDKKIENSIPKWELILIKRGSENRCTLLFKISHFICDYVSARYILDFFFARNPSCYEEPVICQNLSWGKKALLTIRIPLLLSRYFLDRCILGSWSSTPLITPRRTGNLVGRFSINSAKIENISSLTESTLPAILASTHAQTLREINSNHPKTNGTHFILCSAEAYSHPIYTKRQTCCHTSAAVFPVQSGKFVGQNLLQECEKELSFIRTNRSWEMMHLLWNICDILPSTWMGTLTGKGIGDLAWFDTVINPFVFSAEPYTFQGYIAESAHFLLNFRKNVKYNGLCLTSVVNSKRVNLTIMEFGTVLKSQNDVNQYINIFKRNLAHLLSPKES